MQSYPVATINLAALKHNLSRIKQLAPDSKIMSVIKANAYGHGVIEVAQALSEVDAFAVARLTEGIRLRDAGVTKRIVLLEGVHTDLEIQAASRYGLSPVFHHADQIALLTKSRMVKPLDFCWLMLETGMHRLGLEKDAFKHAYDQLKSSENSTEKLGLMSHFANSDHIGDHRNKAQLEQVIHMANAYQLPISLANSAAVLSMPESHTEWLRPGLMLYGISPFADIPGRELGLKPVMKLSARLISIQQLQEGDQVGYGGDWQASTAMTVGTVNIGYGDGYKRHLSNNSQVEINGKIVDVLGRVSMDMICIDLRQLQNVQVGQEVVLWGSDQLPVEHIAQKANTIPYELVCQISSRVTRQYING